MITSNGSIAGAIELLQACVPLIAVPHPLIARVRDRDHENPRIWKDQSRMLGYLSAGSGAVGTLIDVIYQLQATLTRPSRRGLIWLSGITPDRRVGYHPACGLTTLQLLAGLTT